MLLSISRILQESDIDIEYFFRWKIIRVYEAQHGDCVVSITEISALIPEMWLREHFRFQTIKGGKFQKKLRCCVGVEYNKIIWFHQLGW